MHGRGCFVQQLLQGHTKQQTTVTAGTMADANEISQLCATDFGMRLDWTGLQHELLALPMGVHAQPLHNSPLGGYAMLSILHNLHTTWQGMAFAALCHNYQSMTCAGCNSRL